MKNIYVFLLFFLFFQTNSAIPVWDFYNQSIDLFSSQDSTYNYTIHDFISYSHNVKLVKVFNRTDNIITHKNYLTIETTTQEVEFEDIDSYYYNELNRSNLICPKGKYHPYDFDNKTFIIPNEFEEKGDWELKCYNHNNGFFLILYLMNSDKYFFYSCNNCIENDIKYLGFFQNSYYFYLENTYTEERNYRYKFPNIINNDEYIILA